MNEKVICKVIAAVIGHSFKVFATVVVLTSLQNLQAQLNDEEAILDRVDAYIGAQLDCNFVRLVSLLEPRTRHLFRDELSARFDELLRSYSIDQLRAVSGLAAHPKDLQLSDEQFFVLACEQAKLRHPRFVGDPRYLPFDIRDTVFHGNDKVDVTLSYAQHVQTERTAYDFALPFTIVFQRENSEWLMLSCPLSRGIGEAWARDLAALKTQALIRNNLQTSSN